MATHDELERLYVEHGERVRAICASILRDRQEAEDAAQQVFVSALRALRNGTVPRDAEAWLATIARRESWARAHRQQPAPIDPELADVGQEDPAATVVRRAELAEAWSTIAGLPPVQREALLLREVRGLGYEELADDLRLTHASIRSLLNRARRSLRLRFEKGGASLGGAPWLNVLTQLLGDGSSPALSSATRSAAAGLGALAITGGAVAPTLIRHPHRAAAVPHRAAATRRASAPVAAAPGPGVQALVEPRAHRRTERTAVHERHRGRSETGDEGAPPSASGPDSGSDGGTSETSGPPTTTSVGSSGPDGSTPPDAVTATASDGKGGDGSGSQSSGPGSGDTSTTSTSDGGRDGRTSSGDDGSGSSSGSSGSHG